MATIKAIEGRSVHQIQSGQVIVDLNSVVKELVENSLDAGATSIEVRFKNQGLDSIEVQDNGKGIPPDDFDTVALKHHTSKLSRYEDLTSLDTFGFRGEALSSLCALSKFHILTARAEDGAVGKKLDFEVSGKLKSIGVSAAQRGTTVTVDELFYNLPVRRKELEKNIKREYGKVLSLLNAYACISVGVRFTVSNHMPKGKKVVAFSTKSNTTTKENIVNVFGAKMLLSLMKLDLHLDMSPSNGPGTQGARNWATQATDRSMEVQVQGHISRPVFGEGRQAPDRQMFFVNSRPCQLPPVSKAINEVYKSFNVSQSAFIFANLIMDTHAYDVNVSPDKRTIMLHDQTALLESLKSALTEMFDQTDHTVPQSTLPSRKLPAYQPLNVSRRESAKEPAEAEEKDDDGEEDDAAPSDRRPLVSAAPAVKRAINGGAKGTPPSLMQGWLGRDAEPRVETPAAKKKSDDLSKDKQKLVDHMRKQSELEPVTDTSFAKAAAPFKPGVHGERSATLTVDSVAERTIIGTASSGASKTITPAEAAASIGDNEADASDADEMVMEESVDNHDESANNKAATLKRDMIPDPMSTPFGDLFSQRPVQALKPTQPAAQPLIDAPVPLDDDSDHDAASMPAPAVQPPAIPAISPSPQKDTPGPVQSAFDRMRPKRTPLQTAEITIGDKTTTTVLGGSPTYKKRRVHAPVHSQAIGQFGASPLLARGLRNFAAPGSQMAVDSSDMPPHAGRLPEADESESETEAVDDDVTKMPPEVARKKAIPIPNTDERTSDPLDELMPDAADDDAYDEDYIDEREKRIQEDEKVARLIQDAEDAAARPTSDNLRRASQALKNGGNRKEATLQLMGMLKTSVADIEKNAEALLTQADRDRVDKADVAIIKDELDDSNAENKLSLTVSKADFEHMTIVGQFNLGFILAIRSASNERDQDELFIIDQHAADEKYNYERLPVEQEIVLDNAEALKANGFEIETTSDLTEEDESSGRTFRLLTLPISGEKTFEMSDLDELLHLLSEAPAGGQDIPRPKKVQRMLAMRACRSSIMVGMTLAVKRMQKVVRHMGEMEKPWNCPHGRPTMRHLAGLGAWNGWQEGDVLDSDEAEASGAQTGRRTDWKAWLGGSTQESVE
ncbi:ATP-binding mismatch repair protein [Elasticomyces elasticus]|nr:ATP-binding mismatch repair protein [Elasticomyces elasticus]KAK3640026.1 ATP-binding mismatch repair protein [Elasticomyces elasticus]KAK4908216.1 ATP-binding mismatch repair protein [Elasticomyces elasticus]